MVASPKAEFSTTLAVFRPTPGSASSAERVRGTVAQQKASGLFVQLTSAQGGRLVSASSPLAGSVEIHDMAMDGNVMTMRALPDGLVLPAGKPVALKPGGQYIVLDHEAAAGVGISAVQTLHRIEGAQLRREVEAAGFVFEAESDAVRNPADDHTINVFQEPVKGRTDQFVYRFRKPM